MNEKRNYHPSLSEIINQNNEFKIEKIHFLLLRNSTEDFKSTHIDASCRELEPELWQNYIGVDYNIDNVIAYHWFKKKKEDKWVDSFNTLIKMKYHKCNFKTLLAYFLMLGFLSISFNIISSYLKGYVDNHFCKNNILNEKTATDKKTASRDNMKMLFLSKTPPTIKQGDASE
jgi:hypothetical protein